MMILVRHQRSRKRSLQKLQVPRCCRRKPRKGCLLQLALLLLLLLLSLVPNRS